MMGDEWARWDKKTLTVNQLWSSTKGLNKVKPDNKQEMFLV